MIRELPEIFKKHNIRLDAIIPSLRNAKMTACMRLSGLSNTSYKLSFNAEPVNIVVKFYNDLFPMFVNRKTERKVLLETSKFNLHPHLYAQQSWGCIYEYVQGEELHNTKVSIQVLEKIVKRLGQVSNLCSQISPEDKTRSFGNVVSQCKRIAKQIQLKHPHNYKQVGRYVRDLIDERVIADIQRILPPYTVFSHNDSNLTNFIKSHDDLILLDFQFSCPNYIGFDIGNLLNQLATEYTDTFQIRPEWEVSAGYQKIMVKDYFQALDITLEDPERTVRIGRLLSHHFWFFIGMLSFNDPTCRLDLNHYLKRRHEQFFKYYHQLS